MSQTLPGPDGLPRCHWCLATPDYLRYHDTEWGFPVADDTRLFEKLCLEGFQAGLSWRTILAKRENFRAAFAGFDIGKLAQFTPEDAERLLQNAGIIRHRGKIEAAIGNAARAQELIAREGSLAAYIWRFAPPDGAQPPMAATSAAAIALSQDLRKRGWNFVGPTTMHAFMQAMGLINGHAQDCAIHPRAARARAEFTPPAG